MADTTITISAEDLASGVLEKVRAQVSGLGTETKETGDKVQEAGEKIRGVGDQVKEGLENPMQAAKEAAVELLEGTGPLGVALVGVGTIAAAVGVALWELGEHAAEAGGKINDVGEKTGVSAPMVDKYGKAFAVAGSDIDVFSNAMFMLQRGIGEGTQKTADGLAKIGLSVDELKAAGPDHYMELIAEGFAKTEDPAAKAAAAMDIFNRQGREIIPTLNKLTESMHDVSDIEPWTDEQAKEAEHFEMQMASLKVHVGALAESLGRELIPPMTWLVENGIPAFKWGVEATLNLTGLPQMIHFVGQELGYARAGLEAFGLVSTELPKVTGDAKRGLEDWNKSVADMQIAVPSLTDALNTSTTATREMKEEHTRLAEETRKAAAEAAKAEAEYEKQGAAWTNLNSIGATYAETVASLDPLLVAQVEQYVQAGAKVSDLATAYKDELTPAQIDAIDKMVKANEKYAESWEKTQRDIDRTWDEALSTENQNNLKGLSLQLAKLQTQELNEKNAATKKISDETQLQAQLEAIDAKYESLRAVATTANANKVADETAGIWNEFYDLQERRSGTATDHELANVKKWYDDKVIKARAAGIVDQGYYDALDELAKAKMADVYLAHDKFAQDTKKLLDDLLGGDGGWEDTFSKTLAATHSFKDAAKDVWHLIQTDIEGVFADVLSNLLKGFFAPLEVQLGSLLAKMVGIGSATGGGGGWLAAIAAALGGGKGGSVGSTPVTGGHWETPPDGGNAVWVPDPAGGGGDQGQAPTDPNPGQLEASGGVIHAGYAANGGRFPGWAIGVDRVPVWTQDGEGILNTRAMRNIGEPTLNRLNRGDGLMNTAAMENKLDDLHLAIKQQVRALERLHSRLPRMIAAAVVRA